MKILKYFTVTPMLFIAGVCSGECVKQIISEQYYGAGVMLTLASSCIVLALFTDYACKINRKEIKFK